MYLILPILHHTNTSLDTHITHHLHIHPRKLITQEMILHITRLPLSTLPPAQLHIVRPAIIRIAQIRILSRVDYWAVILVLLLRFVMRLMLVVEVHWVQLEGLFLVD
jgi:hypothetical protein